MDFEFLVPTHSAEPSGEALNPKESKMRRWIFLMVWLTSCLVWADLGRFDQDTKHWEVDTGALRCTFFQGCMFPVWFKNAQGEPFPFFIFRDTLCQGDKTAFLDEERWATFRVIENSSLRFIIECQGNFCFGLSPYNRPDERVEATYRYELTRGQSVVKVEVSLRKKEALDFKVELCALRWRFLPFASYGDTDLKGLKYMQEVKVPAAHLHHPVMDLCLGEHQVILRRTPQENTFLFVKDAEGVKSWPAAEQELRFATTLCFGKAQASKEAGK